MSPTTEMPDSEAKLHFGFDGTPLFFAGVLPIQP
jgi:hypothetical protein